MGPMVLLLLQLTWPSLLAVLVVAGASTVTRERRKYPPAALAVALAVGAGFASAWIVYAPTGEVLTRDLLGAFAAGAAAPLLAVATVRIAAPRARSSWLPCEADEGPEHAW